MTYMSEKRAGMLVRQCLNEMYLISDPPISWEDVEKTYPNVKAFYLKHQISLEDYNRIKEKYRKKLPKLYHNSLDWELLNYSPTFKKGEKI
jgi:hypothetical protein